VLQTFPSLRPLFKRRGKLLSGGDGRVELNDAPPALRARPDFGELFLGRSARTQQPAAPARHPPQATTGPAVTAAGAHQASHDEG
jgi:hypothetical protein